MVTKGGLESWMRVALLPAFFWSTARGGAVSESVATMAFALQQAPTARGTWDPRARSLATAVQGRLPYALLFLCAAGAVAALIRPRPRHVP